MNIDYVIGIGFVAVVIVAIILIATRDKGDPPAGGSGRGGRHASRHERSLGIRRQSTGRPAEVTSAGLLAFGAIRG